MVFLLFFPIFVALSAFAIAEFIRSMTFEYWLEEISEENKAIDIDATRAKFRLGKFWDFEFEEILVLKD